MKCPICNNFIHEENTTYSLYHKGKYHNVVEGRCYNCNKIFRWTEIYCLERYEDVEEITED